MAEILKGSPVAAKLTEELSARCEALKARGVSPVLSLLRVGDKPEDLSYEKSIMKRCEKIGIGVNRILYPGGWDVDMNEIISRMRGHVREISNDKSVHGCMMFRITEVKRCLRQAKAYRISYSGESKR